MPGAGRTARGEGELPTEGHTNRPRQRNTYTRARQEDSSMFLIFHQLRVAESAKLGLTHPTLFPSLRGATRRSNLGEMRLSTGLLRAFSPRNDEMRKSYKSYIPVTWIQTYEFGETKRLFFIRLKNSREFISSFLWETLVNQQK